jgi:hypothetical protein
MAKKQTRRSISVSRVTYERLKAFCESNGISMSQFVETRVGDFLGEGEDGATQTAAAMVAAFQGGGAMSGGFETQPQARAERPALSPVGTSSPRAGLPTPAPRQVSSFSGHAASSSGSSSGSSGSSIMASSAPSAPRPSTSVPLTSAAARFAIEPPPPIIKPRADQPAPPVAPRTADQIFTF